MTSSRRARVRLAQLRGAESSTGYLLSLGTLSPARRAIEELNRAVLQLLISDAVATVRSIEAEADARARR